MAVIDAPSVSVVASDATSAAKAKQDATISATASASNAGKAAGRKAVSILELFRFAEPMDRFLYSLSGVCAMLSGIALPLFAILFGDLINAINTGNSQTFVDAVNLTALRMLLLGIGLFITSWIANAIPMYSSERQIRRIRHEYVKSLLRQDFAWYDVNRPGEIATRISEESLAVQDGIGEKALGTVTYFSTFVAGIVIAFVRSAKMTGVMLSFLPFLAIVGGMMKNVMSGMEESGQDAYARAGDAASEVLASLRTVAAFGGERAEAARYDKHLAAAQRSAVSKSAALGAVIGSMMLTMFSLYAVGLYYGSTLIIDSRNANPLCATDVTITSCFTGGQVMQVLFAALIAAMALGQVGPNVGTIAAAQGAAARIFEVIDRVPSIDVYSTGGLAPAAESVRGALEFRDVSFAYPSRPDQPVLTHFSLVVPPGTTVALCGPSGSGKSTLAALVMRLYDPQGGAVLLDGIDLKEYNVAWLRERFGVVQQEPQLFSTSVRENIAMGKPGVIAATDEDVTRAATLALAHGFVSKLPRGYDTQITGVQLSGGEKQRVAIARVIVRNPRILILDEATSALDTASERAAQKALDGLLRQDKARRTALIIAHRLSTIVSADRIVVLRDGAVAESGTHDELVERPNGVYASMWALQRLSSAGDAASSEDDSDVDEASPMVGGAPAASIANAGSGDSAGTGATAPAVPGAAGRAVSVPGVAGPASREVSAAAAVGSGAVITAKSGATAATVSAAGATAAPVVEPADKATPVSASHLDALVAEAATASGLDAKTTALLSKSAKGLSVVEIRELAAALALPPVPFSRLWVYLRPDACLLVVATLISAANGLLFPAFSLVLSRFTAAFYDPVDANVHRAAIEYMGWFFLLAGGAFALNFLQTWLFGIVGGRFVRRLRYATYSSLLRQEIGFYDLPSNSPGRLAARIGQESVLVGRLMGPSFAMSVQMGASMVAGLIIAFTASWRLSLLILATTPLLILFGAAEMKAMAGLTGQLTKAFEGAAQAASEAMVGARAVAAFGLQANMLAKFDSAMQLSTELGLRRARFGGLGQGASQFMMFAVYALCFWAGAQWIQQGLLSFQDLLQSFFAIAMSATGLGSYPWKRARLAAHCNSNSLSIALHLNLTAVSKHTFYPHPFTCRAGAFVGHASAFAVDAGKAEAAKRSLVALIDRESAIDPTSSTGVLVGSTKLKSVTDAGANATASSQGRIELRDVHFTYPSRPETEVLRGISLVAEPGQTTAIVGPSGSGKSSIVQLLMRMYDPQSGSILLDGTDIRQINIQSLRATEGWVQQEAPLFADSVAYNIGYGLVGDKPQPDQGVPRDAGADALSPTGFKVPPEVVEAATAANAAGFIGTFKHGYATFVGDRGNQLSGGQKQRVAIARAIIRRPLLLLLDEATSALDSESERIVTETIERLISSGHAAGEKRTTIVIAHRLSTIKRADKIVVIDSGRVIEVGNHDELLVRPDGVYRRLALAQDPHAADHIHVGANGATNATHNSGTSRHYQ